MQVLGVVPFNVSLYLLCPDESFAAYTVLVLELFRLTSFMLFKILLHFSAQIVANSTDKHLAGVGFGVCHKVSLLFEVPVTAFLRTNPCSHCTMYNFMGFQLTFKSKAFFTFVTCKTSN